LGHEMSRARALLGDLFPEAQGTPGASTPIEGIAFDSRAVKPGFVFVAVPGAKADGLIFASDAAAAGAVAVVGGAPRPAALDGRVTYVQVHDPRRALALAAARF